MSARPRFEELVPRRADAPLPEELDLWISRSLDGDLAPADEEELRRLFDSEPRARARRDELSALVAELGALPSPEPPFALATRVTSQVGERVAGVGSAFHRFGLFPTGGALVAAAAVLFVAVLGGSFLFSGKPSESPAVAERAAPRAAGASAAAAEKEDAPLSVFLADASPKPAPPAESRPGVSHPAVSQPAASQPAVSQPAAPRRAAEESRGYSAAFAPEPDALGKKRGSAPSPERGGRGETAAPSLWSRQTVREDAAEADDAKAPRDAETTTADASSASGVRAAAPAPPAPSEEVQKVARFEAPAAAQAAPGARAGADLSRAKLAAASAAPRVAVILSPKDRAAWRAPVATAAHPLRPPLSATARLALDARGHVLSVERLRVSEEGAARAVETLLRGLVFEPLAAEPRLGAVDVELRLE